MPTRRTHSKMTSTDLWTTVPISSSDLATEWDDVSVWTTPSAESTTNKLPSAFCWTRMQAESGQKLEQIIARKELERQLGTGLFFWGIGSPLGNKAHLLLQRSHSPKVAFSIMKSKPRHIDTHPDSVLLWTGYRDISGRIQKLPDNVLLLSRGSTELSQKRRHYALVCHSRSPLSLASLGRINLEDYCNLGSKNPIGASQVTAIVERLPKHGIGSSYEVNMVADLVAPHFVRLTLPIKIAHASILELESMLDNGCNLLQWKKKVASIRQRTDRLASQLFADAANSINLFSTTCSE